MTALSRVTVIGPERSADLAVPRSETVADLLPLLAARTAGEVLGDEQWVLQRQADEPFDLTGTPESLDWLEGERLFLLPAAEAIPEAVFDDVADGVATTVRRLPMRWRREHDRRASLLLAVAPVAVGAFALAGAGAWPALAALGVALVLASAVASRRSSDMALVALLGLAGCVFGGLAAGTVAELLGAQPQASVVPGLVQSPADPLLGHTVAVGGLTAATLAAALLVFGHVWARTFPVAPFGLLLVAGVLTGATGWLSSTGGWPEARSAGLTACTAFGLLLLTPRLTLRLTRLRPPQLPRTAEELQTDIEPAAAADVEARTRLADGYITAVCVAVALVTTVDSAVLVLRGVGWAPPVLVALLAACLLLHSRAVEGVWQRGALLAAGTAGLALLAGSGAVPAWLTAAALGWAFLVLVIAALRPVERRVLPVWVDAANIAEGVSAVAVLPVLLHLFGLYTWARGLGG